MKSFKKIVITAGLLLTVLSLVACGTKQATSNSQSSQNDTHLTDAQGHKVTIPAKPKRIIASYLEDYLTALDVTPVTQWTVGGGSKQAYLGLDVPLLNYDLPYEDVLKEEPDLILVESNAAVEGGKYDQYSKIAPTYVVVNGADVTWKDRLTDIAKVLGKEAQGKEVINKYEDLLVKTKETYGDKIKGKSAAVLWVTNNSAFMVAEGRSSGDLLYQQLGFEVPNLTKEISKEATSDWSAVSLEKLAQLDADYLILVNSDSGAAMFKDDVWKNIPAVKSGNLWEFGPDASWLYNGPIAYTKMVEDIQNKLK